MAISKVAQISRLAKKIRKKGEKWQSAIKRASKSVGTKSKPAARSKGSGARKSVPSKRKTKKAYRPRKPIHQTGTSSQAMDKRIKAKPPGKRNGYYEYRKNRSDMPGKMTGIKGGAYQEMILSRMKDNYNKIRSAEGAISYWRTEKAKYPGNKELRLHVAKTVKAQRALIATLKKDNIMLKRLLK
jgi:hypothetical protein